MSWSVHCAEERLHYQLHLLQEFPSHFFSRSPGGDRAPARTSEQLLSIKEVSLISKLRRSSSRVFVRRVYNILM